MDTQLHWQEGSRSFLEAFRAIPMLLEAGEPQVPDEPLRLLHVVPTYLPAVRYGGPIQTVHALCRALAAQGHDVHVFTTNVDGPLNSNVPLHQPVDMEGVKVTYFPVPALRRLYWSPPLRRALFANASEFDLVHLHAVFLWPTWVGARASRAGGVPYVVSPRGMLVPELIRRRSRWVKTAWITLVDRRNIENASAVHTTSMVEARHLAGFGWDLPRVETIPHGVDDPPIVSEVPLSPDVTAATAGGPYTLAFGRISWEKGLDRLIAALPLVPGARVVIAGGDADRQASFLAAEAERLGVASRVTILARHVDGADKESLFANARAYAMTSLSENFGLAAFEAMRRGLPVLVTADVGMSEIVRDTSAGIVVEATPAAIAEGLSALLADVTKSRTMGEAGRAHVVAHFSWKAMGARMDTLYRSILGSGANTGATT